MWKKNKKNCKAFWGKKNAHTIATPSQAYPKLLNLQDIPLYINLRNGSFNWIPNLNEKLGNGLSYYLTLPTTTSIQLEKYQSVGETFARLESYMSSVTVNQSNRSKPQTSFSMNP